MKMDKRGVQLNDVVPIAITLVVIAITLSIGGDVLEAVRDGQCAAGFSYNATAGNCYQTTNASVIGGMGASFNASTGGLDAVAELGSFQDTWAVVIALAVIVGVLGFLITRR